MWNKACRKCDAGIINYMNGCHYDNLCMLANYIHSIFFAYLKLYFFALCEIELAFLCFFFFFRECNLNLLY